MLARGLDGPSAAAAATGVQASQISRYLNGRINPSARTVKKLARWARTSEQDIWALIPEAAPGELRVLESEEMPAWARKMQEDIDLLLHRHGVELPTLRLLRSDAPITSQPGHRPRLLVQTAPGRWLTVVETDDLVEHVPSIPFNAALWLDAERPTRPGAAVYVEKHDTVYARMVAPDGVTLTSPVPGAPTLRLDAVDRIYGVAHHLQVTW